MQFLNYIAPNIIKMPDTDDKKREVPREFENVRKYLIYLNKCTTAIRLIIISRE